MQNPRVNLWWLLKVIKGRLDNPILEKEETKPNGQPLETKILKSRFKGFDTLFQSKDDMKIAWEFTKLSRTNDNTLKWKSRGAHLEGETFANLEMDALEDELETNFQIGTPITKHNNKALSPNIGIGD